MDSFTAEMPNLDAPSIFSPRDKRVYTNSVHGNTSRLFLCSCSCYMWVQELCGAKEAPEDLYSLGHVMKTRQSSAKHEGSASLFLFDFFFSFFFLHIVFSNKARDSEILEKGPKASCYLPHGLRESSQPDAISAGGTQAGNFQPTFLRLAE